MITLVPNQRQKELNFDLFWWHRAGHLGGEGAGATHNREGPETIIK